MHSTKNPNQQNTKKYAEKSKMNKSLKYSITLISALLLWSHAQCFIRRAPSNPNPVAESIADPLQQQRSSVTVNLEWTELDKNVYGFVAQAQSLSTFFTGYYALNLTSSLNFMGALRVDGMGTGGWGIPDCTPSVDCITTNPVTFDVLGKNYNGTEAELPLNFTIVSSAPQRGNAKVPFALIQTKNQSSPYPLGPYNALGLGPKSAFWPFWRNAYNKNGGYVQFAIKYTANQNNTVNIIQAPKDSLSGSKLILTRKAAVERNTYSLERLKYSFALNNSNFGIQDKNSVYTNYIGSKGCVYPDGVFYFAVQDKEKFDQFNKKVNFELCG